MFKRIMVPLDGSKLAEEALDPALAVVSQFGGELLLFRVVTPPHVSVHFDGVSYAELLVQMREQANWFANDYLQKLQNTLTDDGYNVRYGLVEDEFVAEAVLEEAHKEEIDLIVMSTHGRGGIRRWVFGSIADKVLRQAEIPVMLIRASEEAENWEQSSQPEMQTNLPPIK